jgi:xanthine dehydrogenase accessory factor
MQQDLALWQFIYTRLKKGMPVMLMIVVESTGSSPGRQGFKMAVCPITPSGGIDIIGSIGGGIMEQKLVELAKEKLLKNYFKSFLKKQIHRKDTPQLQSGMICSGEQTILFKPLIFNDLKIIKNIILSLKKNTPSVICLSPTLFSIVKNYQNSSPYIFKNENNDWLYEENIGFKKHLYIIGGGHCGLALSELMSKMGFYIRLFDDRPDLNTFKKNKFAHEKHIIDYDKIADFIPSGDEYYVVVMTLGYRSDELIIRRLIDKNFKYLGILGSQAKADTLIENLKKDGFMDSQIEKLHMPIGLKINSQTPMEIAVSIAAEIVFISHGGHKETQSVFY